MDGGALHFLFLWTYKAESYREDEDAIYDAAIINARFKNPFSLLTNYKEARLTESSHWTR